MIATRRDDAPSGQLDNVLFASLLLVYIAPLILFHHFPSQDGAAHVNNANILRHYYDARYSVFRKYYVLDTTPVPNWTGHILLRYALVFFTPAVAEKLLVAVVVVGLPFAIRYAAGSNTSLAVSSSQFPPRS